MTRLATATVVLYAATASVSAAADLAMPIQRAAACAPRTSAEGPPSSPLWLVGAQDTVVRTVAGSRDLVVIAGGRPQGVDLDQRYFVRRAPRPSREAEEGPRAISTKGWVRIVAVNDTTSLARVEHACDGMVAGDFLEPFVPLALPPDIDRTDTSGLPDFSSPSRVLFGDDERRNGGPGEFMIGDAGADAGVVAGQRFAIYRDLAEPGLPLAAVGEAVVVSVAPETSVFRITRARHAVESGDFLIPRR
jgi:hypothetical protein